MSLVDIDSWVFEHGWCERLGNDIHVQIAARDNEPKNSQEYSKQSAAARINLKKFSTEINQLNCKLDSFSRTGELTIEELERRQRQIERLQTRLAQLENQFKSVNLPSRSVQASSSLWEDSDDAPVIDTNTYTADQLRKDKTRILEDQNRGLDVLSETISRQKNLATRLGEEFENQNEIIDDLTTTVEITNSRVASESRHVGSVGRQDSTWGYWIVILVLFLAICIVAVI